MLNRDLVKCYVCSCDDIQLKRSAKLQCGHTICYGCLEYKFRLSICDPKFMPPKCCSNKDGLAKTLYDLFDYDFRKFWAKAAREFLSKSPVYCANPDCGVWITDSQVVTKDNYECKKCNDKVCGTCKCKWHGSEGCKEKTEVREILSVAEEKRRQRRHDLGVSWGIYKTE